MIIATSERPITYHRRKGNPGPDPDAGTRLIMLDGTIETSAQGGKQLQVLSISKATPS